MIPELRYNYTGSYRDPKRCHFGCGEWMDEATCRQAIAANLRSAEVAGESLNVIIQQKKSRWLPFKHGTAAEIFPDLVAQVERERAVRDIVEDAALPVAVRGDAAYAVKFGRVAEALANAEALATVLRRVLAVGNSPESELLARWQSRCAEAAAKMKV